LLTAVAYGDAPTPDADIGRAMVDPMGVCTAVPLPVPVVNACVLYAGGDQRLEPGLDGGARWGARKECTELLRGM
jgi:hypothetical protein